MAMATPVMMPWTTEARGSSEGTKERAKKKAAPTRPTSLKTGRKGSGQRCDVRVAIVAVCGGLVGLACLVVRVTLAG